MHDHRTPTSGPSRILVSRTPNPNGRRNRRRHVRIAVLAGIAIVVLAVGGAGVVRVLELGGAAIAAPEDEP